MAQAVHIYPVLIPPSPYSEGHKRWFIKKMPDNFLHRWEALPQTLVVTNSKLSISRIGERGKPPSPGMCLGSVQHSKLPGCQKIRHRKLPGHHWGPGTALHPQRLCCITGASHKHSIKLQLTWWGSDHSGGQPRLCPLINHKFKAPEWNSLEHQHKENKYNLKAIFWFMASLSLWAPRATQNEKAEEPEEGDREERKESKALSLFFLLGSATHTRSSHLPQRTIERITGNERK